MCIIIPSYDVLNPLLCRLHAVPHPGLHRDHHGETYTNIYIHVYNNVYNTPNIINNNPQANALEATPSVAAFMESMKAIPEVAQYLQSRPQPPLVGIKGSVLSP